MWSAGYESKRGSCTVMDGNAGYWIKISVCLSLDWLAGWLSTRISRLN